MEQAVEEQTGEGQKPSPVRLQTRFHKCGNAFPTRFHKSAHNSVETRFRKSEYDSVETRPFLTHGKRMGNACPTWVCVHAFPMRFPCVSHASEIVR